MAKIKFHKVEDNDRQADIYDEDGDHFSALIFSDRDDTDYFVTFSIGGEAVGLKRTQAIEFALALLREATRA